MSSWFHSPRAYVLVFLITLVFRIATAAPLSQAGYMDASYAIHVAENVAHGDGLIENVLWNYLDSPSALPHPSNLYWMPLPTLLIAPFFALLGNSYHVAQIPFVLVSSFLPLFAFYLSRRLFGRDDYAWCAALLTTFSGFYTVYWVSPDNFAPFALTTAVCIYLIARGVETRRRRYLLAAGALAALSHLSRADGVLLIAVAPAALLLNSGTRSVRSVVTLTAIFLLGYLAVMTPWFVRDYVVAGSPYPSAGTKTLWLTNYDELFRYANDLTLSRYLAWGIIPILRSKLSAAGLDALVVAFGALQIYLAPFAVIGLWRARQRQETRVFVVYAAFLYAAMVLLFTFPSSHGSMLHSASAFVPFVAVAAPPGIDGLVEWIAKRRRAWNAAAAGSFFRVGFVLLSAVLSVFLYAQGVLPHGDSSGSVTTWNQRDASLPEVARWLNEHAAAGDLVMTVDPPSFYNVSHRPAIVIPTDGTGAVLQAASRYGARYLILQYDHPAPLSDLYKGTASVPGLVPIAHFQDAPDQPTFLFEITP